MSLQDNPPVEAEAPSPQPTEAAKARAKKARKPKFDTATPGAKSVNLTVSEKAYAVKIEVAEKYTAYITQINEDAEIVSSQLSKYAVLCGNEDESKQARLVFKESLADPAFRKRLQNVKDFFSTKEPHLYLTSPSGKKYKTGPLYFKGECGVTYEYIRRLLNDGDIRMKFAQVLLTEGTTQAPPQQAPPQAPPQQPQPKAPPQHTETPINVEAEVEVLPQEEPQLSHSSSVSERVQFALAYVFKCVKFLSPSETDEFYGSLIAKLQSEMQFVEEVEAAVEA
jgi:hypothetical protein